MAALVSGGAPGAWSRWSILAAPGPELCAGEPLEALEWLSGNPSSSQPQAQPLKCEDLARNPPPFTTGWIGWLSYDLGRVIEPAAAAVCPGAAIADRPWPLLRLQRCDGALAYDHLERRWWLVGSAELLPPLEALFRSAAARPPLEDIAYRAGPLRSATGRAAYERAVARVIDLIAAGDVFQVNLAHRLSAPFAGSPRRLFLDLLHAAGPWFGAFIEAPTPGEAILSISPELFLDLDPRSRRIVTRPIKGTRPATAPVSELLASAKDEAELVMIIDLMRNDLGRVCKVGSVRVTERRGIERHAHAADPASGVLHSVATIEGRVRKGLSAAEILRAAFPPGSVTGAPKIRCMQIIDELEPVRRGPYCGAIGFFGDDGAVRLSVAIRTATISPDPPRSGPSAASYNTVRGMLDYSVGAGIVADSDPASEWRETLTKAAVVQRVLQRAAREDRTPAASPAPAGAAP